MLKRINKLNQTTQGTGHVRSKVDDKKSAQINWDKLNPRMQYDIFKGFGNPLPGTANRNDIKK